MREFRWGDNYNVPPGTIANEKAYFKRSFSKQTMCCKYAQTLQNLVQRANNIKKSQYPKDSCIFFCKNNNCLKFNIILLH